MSQERLDFFNNLVFVHNELKYVIRLRCNSEKEYMITFCSAFITHICVLIHQNHGNVTSTCRMLAELWEQLRFCAYVRVERTTAWTWWESSDTLADELSLANHPLNHEDIKLDDLIAILKSNQFPVVLQYEPEECLDASCLNVYGIALNFEFNLDDGQIRLLVGNNYFEHSYTWPMKSCYRFKSLKYFGYSEEFLEQVVKNCLAERLSWHDKLQPFPTQAISSQIDCMLSHCAAITIQAQVRRYLVWLSGFEPGTGRLYKKANRSFEATVAAATSTY